MLLSRALLLRRAAAAAATGTSARGPQVWQRSVVFAGQRTPEAVRKAKEELQQMEEAADEGGPRGKADAQGAITMETVSVYEGGAHRSDAEERVRKFPVTDVHGDIAVCDGGGGALGHPVAYIELHTAKPNEVIMCPYCSLRYRMAPGYDPAESGHH